MSYSESLQQILVDLRSIAVGVARLEGGWQPSPDPEPEPDPAPIPDPEPPGDPEPFPPPDPDGKPADIVRMLDANNVLTFKTWKWFSRYSRAQRLKVLKGQDQLTLLSMNMGGQSRPFRAFEYTLLCDGEPIMTQIAPPLAGGDADKTELRDASTLVFDVDSTQLSDGWHVFDVIGGQSEVCVPWPMYVLNGPLPEQDWMPVCEGSFSMRGTSKLDHRIMWVPARDDCLELPLSRDRKFTHFDHVPEANELWFEQLVPIREEDIGRCNVNEDGIRNTFTLQWYKWNHFTDPMPVLPMLDGERGKGCVGYPTHIEIGEANCEDFGDIGNVYVCTPWSIVKVRKTGKITTLAGWRHKHPKSYWDGPQDLELVGDWSEIPPERHGFRELWGMALDRYTTRTNTEADRIPTEMNLRPHHEGVTWYAADTQWNRICKVKFDPFSHATEPKVTEFLTELNDPWDCVIYQPDKSQRGTLIVAERGDSRICEYSIETGELLRVIAQGAKLIEVTKHRFVRRLADMDTLRAEDCVGPEGLAICYDIDGGDWLYWGSIAVKQIRRINLATGEIQVMVNDAMGGNYMKIAVSDGTFMPKGTLFATSWIVQDFGAPRVWLPDGTKYRLMASGSKARSRGRGKYMDNIGYSAAVAVGNGRCIFGGADEGLWQVSLAADDDPIYNKRLYLDGKNEYIENGYDLRYGDNGMNLYDDSLPWGESDEIDYYLEWFGHSKQ